MTSRSLLIRSLGLLSALVLVSGGCNSAKMQEARARWQANWRETQETWRSNWQAHQDRFERANAKWNAIYEEKFHEGFNRRVRPSQYRLDPVMGDPPADEASAVRAWDTSVYHYPNGSVSANPTYTLNYEDRPYWLDNDYVYAAVQPGIVMADVVLMPFWLHIEPPWIDIKYHGAQYGPSMTVAPPQ